MAGEKIICNKSDLTAVADSIRSKLGVADFYVVSELGSTISNELTKKLPTLTNPGTASDLLSEKELIDQDGNIVTGTIPTKSAATITPGTADQIIASSIYLTGVQTIKGDSNLVASNIKSGTSIFGVTGTYSGGTPNLQAKSVTYTSNGTATVTPDSGYDGLSSVDVQVNVAGSGSGSNPESSYYVSIVNDSSVAVVVYIGDEEIRVGVGEQRNTNSEYTLLDLVSTLSIYADGTYAFSMIGITIFNGMIGISIQ